jgi:fructose-1,6-bisphosphatase/inositol monophosphatase family enzyme
MASSIDPDKVSDIIREAAAKHIMPRYKQLQQGDISTKSGPNDLVTVADKETEEALDKALTKLYPGSVVVGEESISAGTKNLDALKDGDNSKIVFVTDPVDGTWNYVHGNPEFCVMLACVENGEIRYGWIYDVLTKRMMLAEKGAGAYFDGNKMQVAKPKPMADLIGHAGKKYFPAPMRPHIEGFKPEVKKLFSISCAGHEYLRIASGAADFGIYSRIRPWDHFAGTLAVQEAGGFVAKWDGTPYAPKDDFGGLVAASNEQLWKDIQSRLIKPMVQDYKKHAP